MEQYCDTTNRYWLEVRCSQLWRLAAVRNVTLASSVSLLLHFVAAPCTHLSSAVEHSRNTCGRLDDSRLQ